MKRLFKPIENPLVKDTFWNRYKYWYCRKNGHVHSGPYYGMPQAICSRCGKKLSGANASVPNWSEPD